MNTQPIDPRALKAAYDVTARYENLDFEQTARIIQSHFAESVNHALLKALSELVADPIIRQWLVRTETISDYEKLIALAKSQPPSMADELAEACVEMLQFIEMRMAHTGCQSVREILQELEHVKGVSEVSTSHHLGCKETSRTVHLDKIRGLISAYKSPNK